MSTTLEEGGLLFDFSDGWWCDKWDGSPASKYEIFPGKTPACVDLVGIDRHGVVYLIEVKDHSANIRENDEPWADVLRKKVHDTVMGVITAHRRGDTLLSQPLARALVKKARVFVVLWLEEPMRGLPMTGKQRRALNGVLLRKNLETTFRWLDARVLVVNRDNCHECLDGLSVRRK